MENEEHEDQENQERVEEEGKDTDGGEGSPTPARQLWPSSKPGDGGTSTTAVSTAENSVNRSDGGGDKGGGDVASAGAGTAEASSFDGSGQGGRVGGGVEAAEGVEAETLKRPTIGGLERERNKTGYRLKGIVVR